MVRRSLALLALLGPLALGCVAPSADATSKQDDNFLNETGAARLSFTKDGQGLEGQLFEGESVSITYDPSRMTNCTHGTGDPHHGPEYDYTLYYKWQSAPDSAFHPVLVANTNGSAQAQVTAPFQATGLEVYVELTNPQGCTQYDSASGANFTYPVGKARLPAIHFQKDGSVAQDGPLTGGSTILVDYASLRLENCINSGRKLRMFGRIDGADMPAQELVETSPYLRTIGRVPTSAGAKHLELWFETVDFHACVQWDSANGANFDFDLQ